MRKLLSLIFLIVACCASALATDVTVSSFNTAAVYQSSDSVVVLRLYYSDTFVDSLGNVIVGGAVGSGSFYKSVTCSLNPTTKIVTCSSFTLPSTLDASKPTVTVTGVLYGGPNANSLAQRSIIFANWKIPASPTPTTFADLNTYNSARRPSVPDGYYTTTQVDAKINALTSAAANASDVIKGVGKTSVAPASASNPIFEGANDPHIAASATPVYWADQYPSFNAAVAAIGSSAATLVVSKQMAATTVTTPATLSITFVGDGGLTVAGGNTVTALGPVTGIPGKALSSGAGVFTTSPQRNSFVTSGPSIAAPGLVTLVDAGAGSLSAGTYKIAVASVNAEGGESNFDPRGYFSNNSITIGGSHNITVSWLAVPGASAYRVYVWGPAGVFYQRYFETTNTSYTLSTNPVGPVAVPITVTPSNTGGSLRYGNYYFAVSAEFSDGATADQTNYNEFPVAQITSDTGSVAVSWTALTGATQYRVYVVSEQDGNPRIHTKYFTTASTSATVTGTETYITGAKAIQILGDSEAESSGVGVFGSIRTTTNTKSFFAADIQIAADKGGTAVFQANRYSNDSGTFAGLDIRKAGQVQWQIGALDTSNDLGVFTGSTSIMDFQSGGNVGIGTASPMYKLDIQSPPTSSGNSAEVRIKATTAGGSADIRIDGKDDTADSGIYLFKNNVTRWAMGDLPSIGFAAGDFVVTHYNGSVFQESLHINASNRFTGVQVIPSSAFHVRYDNGASVTASIADQIRVDSNAAGHLAGVHFTDGSSDGFAAFVGNVTAASRYLSLTARNTLSDFTVAGNGNVGVGTASPSALFSVGGSSQFQVDANGFVTTPRVTIGGGTTILKHLSATATLDFANLASIGCEDLTITVTGAASGDTVALGVPSGSIVSNGIFYAWISGANTATVRYCTLTSGDPASGTFRVDVWQH